MVESKSKQYSKTVKHKGSNVRGRLIVNKGTLLKTKQIQHKVKNSGGKIIYSSRAIKNYKMIKDDRSDGSSLPVKKENSHLLRNKYTIIHQADLIAKDIINSEKESPLGLQAVSGILDSVDYAKSGLITIRRGIKVIKNAGKVISASRSISNSSLKKNSGHAAPPIKYKRYTLPTQLKKKSHADMVNLSNKALDNRVYYEHKKAQSKVMLNRRSVKYKHIHHSAAKYYKGRNKQDIKKPINNVNHKTVRQSTVSNSFAKTRRVSSAKLNRQHHSAADHYRKRVHVGIYNNKVQVTRKSRKILPFSNKLIKRRILYRYPAYKKQVNDRFKGSDQNNKNKPIYKEIKGAKVNIRYINKIKAIPKLKLKMGTVTNESNERKSGKINKAYVAKSFAKWSVKTTGHASKQAFVSLKERTFNQLRHEDMDMGVQSIAEAEKDFRKAKAAIVTIKNTGQRINSGIKTVFNVAEKLSDKKAIKHDRVKKEIGHKDYNHKSSIRTAFENKSHSKVRTKKINAVDKNLRSRINKPTLVNKVKKAVSNKVKNILVKVLLVKSLAIIGIAILLTIMLLIAINSVIGLLFGVSWKSEDEHLTETFLYVTKLDTNLEFKIYNMENESKYARIKYFDYNFEIEPYTDIEKLMTYLDVKFEDYKLNDVKSLIDKIHSEMYTLSTETTHKKEGHGDDRETVYTLHITLSGFDFDEFIDKHRESKLDENILSASGDERAALSKFKKEHKNELLSDEQYDMYTTMLELGGDTMRKVLASPFPGDDWYSRVSSRYGYRLNPLEEKPEIVIHRALDIPFYQGKVICASMSGKACVIYNHSSYGNYVTIDNGTMRTLYAHCSKILISDGQDVSMGDSIAEVGSTGDSTGPHLHMEYTYKGKNLNPLFYVER